MSRSRRHTARVPTCGVAVGMIGGGVTDQTSFRAFRRVACRYVPDSGHVHQFSILHSCIDLKAVNARDYARVWCGDQDKWERELVPRRHVRPGSRNAACRKREATSCQVVVESG